MNRLIKSKRGFTFMELLIVILIIGILAGVSIPIANNVYNNNKARPVRAKAESIYTIAEQVNNNISNGTIVIGVHFNTTQLALNNRLTTDSQINGTITDSSWAGLTTAGNYIAIDSNNKVIAVYVIQDGIKAKWTSAGLSN